MRFTTNIFPQEERREALRFALKRLSFTLRQTVDNHVYGELIRIKSGYGFTFIRSAGTAQAYDADFREGPEGLWLMLLLEGQGEAISAEDTFPLGEGDVLCGPSNAPISLSFSSDQRCLWVLISATALDQRFRGPAPDRPRRLLSEHGAARMMMGMLRGLADIMHEGPDQILHPVEMALPEFLLASLLSEASTKALGGAAGVRAALLERIFQMIEMRLADPGLSYQQVAREHGISPRYLQKLFESIGDNFGHYVKVRRLERCRLDLCSPLHAQKSISDILFQWGFNDSASFSRAFREQYGVAPREYRKRLTSPERQEVA